MKILHDLTGFPQNSIVVKIFCWVEPKVKPHLSPYNIPISTSSDVYICLQDIWLIWGGTKEFNVYFIMVSRVVLVV